METNDAVLCSKIIKQFSVLQELFHQIYWVNQAIGNPPVTP